MIATLFLLALAGEPKVTVEAPSYLVTGAPFKVRIAVEAPADGAKLEGWQLTPSGFTVDGKPLAEHGSEPAVELKPAEKKSVDVDLTPALEATGDFDLAWGTLPAKKIRVLEAAPKGMKFIDEAAVPTADLTKYWVLLRTSRGDILAEFWPDVAPNHVRNFLDLSETGFYDGVTFHRVIPGFMIQGGDPDGTGSGNGPRTLKAEFSDRKHTPGVLSAARQGTADPKTGRPLPGPQDPKRDTASCQFFIMHKDYPSLDGNYSAFGKVITGMDAVEKIVNTPTGAMNKPKTPQVIEKAIVVRAPADPAAWKGAQ